MRAITTVLRYNGGRGEFPDRFVVHGGKLAIDTTPKVPRLVRINDRKFRTRATLGRVGKLDGIRVG